MIIAYPHSVTPPPYPQNLDNFLLFFNPCLTLYIKFPYCRPTSELWSPLWNFQFPNHFKQRHLAAKHGSGIMTVQSFFLISENLVP